jgi:lysyl-tRNA synthetase class II
MCPWTTRPRTSAGPPLDIPYRFDRTHQTAEIVAGWSSLEPGDESGVTVGVAGRLMLLRKQGKAAFGELRDAVGCHPAVRPRHVTAASTRS